MIPTFVHTLQVEVDHYGTITDYKYAGNGRSLAVATSDGMIIVYQRNSKTFTKKAEFRADEGSIWSLAWGDSKYGNVLAIGSFKKKVAVFQEINHEWCEVASHYLHDASVNCVEWSPVGVKLYSAASDGKVAILELVKSKQWKSSIFQVSDSAIASLAVQPLPLGEIVSEQMCQNVYPRIATISKDFHLRIWSHHGESYYDQNHVKREDMSQCGYSEILKYQIPKESVKNILWRPVWGSFAQSFEEMSIVYCSESGNLRVLKFGLQKQGTYSFLSQENLYEGEAPVVRISQSLTGNFISASIAEKEKSTTLTFMEQDNKWNQVERIEL